MPRLIQLTRGLEAIVDDADFELVRPYKWRAHVRGRSRTTHVFYARGYIPGAGVDVYMHRLITRCPGGLVVHHVDGNGLNCRRMNMHLTTIAVNTGFGSSNVAAGLSGFRGVDRHHTKWRARIRVDGIETTVGRFDDAREAAYAWDRAALNAWGPFVRTNFEHPEQTALHLEANAVEMVACGMEGIPF